MAESSLQISDLDDDREKVYVFGLNTKKRTESELDALSRAVDDAFDEAGTLVLGLPIEGSVEVSEMDPEDVQEIIDYGNLQRQIDIDSKAEGELPGSEWEVPGEDDG